MQSAILEMLLNSPDYKVALGWRFFVELVPAYDWYTADPAVLLVQSNHGQMVLPEASALHDAVPPVPGGKPWIACRSVTIAVSNNQE